MYKLYTANNCHQCAEVKHFLVQEKLKFSEVNVDLDNEQPPVIIYAFPALFLGQELLAYGTDIIRFLQKNPKA